MNKRQNYRVDSIIKSHATIISDAHTLNSKIIYSINCLLNNLEYQNSNRNANITYLQPTVNHLISLGEKAKDIAEDHLKAILRLINTLLSEANTLSAESAVSLISIIMKINTNNDAMSEDLCHEIVTLCSNLKNEGESSKLLLQLMATKMSPQQSLTLIDSFRKNELYITQVNQLISLGTHYNNNQQILRRVFQGLHWQISNVLSQRKDTSRESKDIINFIKLTLANNIKNIKIVSLCGLIYREMTDSFKMVDKASISKNLDSFLKTNALQATTNPYLVESDKLIASFADLAPILQLEISIETNKLLHYLLSFYSANQLPWREELLTSQSNGKGSIAKELLLRCTEHYSTEPRPIKSISQKDQLHYSNFLPIECLRSLPSILNKLHREPTPHNALQTIGFFHNLPKSHPQLKEVLLLLLEIYLKNRQFASLQQIQRLVKDQISGQQVIKKLKEKGTIKDRDSNRQSKRYFIFIPLVCTRAETESVADQLSSIFIHQTVHIAFKVYVANFVFSKMILNPSKTFMLFLLRYLQSSFSSNLLKLFLIYLQPHSLENNPAVSEWYLKHFSEITQKLLQFLFSKLVIRQISQTSKLLFLLEKFNVFGQNWINSYRWVLNNLEEINEIYSDHTIDCLQIFQMIIEKIAISKIPESVIQRFEKIVLKNWTKYTQQHLYVIQRIVTLLNEHSYIGFKQVAMPPLQKLSKDNSNYLNTYISNITFNLFFSHIDIDKAFQSLLCLCNTYKDDFDEHAALAALNLLLFLFQDSQQAVSTKSDEFVIQTISKFKNSSEVQGKCIEYLSRVPHNINILKIPLLSLTMQGFYNTVWVSNLTQLLNIVTQLKPKAIGSYKLQQVIKSMAVFLISSENKVLVDSLMDYIEATCFVQGDYQQTLDLCLPAMENMLRAERCGVDYRKSLVQFVLGTLVDYQYELNQENLWFLMSKYASQAEIILLILQYFQKFAINDQLLHEKLLMRVVLIHTQNDKIQQKCKTIFKLHAPKSSLEQQFNDQFSKSNFSKCQELITQVNNPYALNFSAGDIRSLLEWKNAAETCKKLIRFLYNHPENQPKFYHCQAFILNPQYISYLGEVVDKIDSEILVDKFNNNIKKQFLLIKKHPSLEILQKTVIQMLKNKQTILKVKNLLHQAFKHREDDFGILLKLFILIFSRLKKDKRSNDDLRAYFKFFTEVVGELQLKDKEKSHKFITKNLVYTFPFFINNSQIIDPSTSYSSLLAHYRSVITSFTSIQKQVGSNRYFLLLSRSILQSSKNSENKGIFVQEYLKTYLLMEGNEQISLKEQDKQNYRQILIEILQLVNKVAQTKTRQNNAKLEYPFLNGYAAHLIFLLNQGVTLDIATLQIINSITPNLDTLISAEDYRATIKQALIWISKQIEKCMPVKNQQRTSPNKPPREPNIQSKEQKIKSQIPVQGQNKSNVSQPRQYQTSKKEQPRDTQAQSQESYVKYRQIQQQITITQTKTTNKTTLIVLNKDSSTNSLFNESIQKPKEETFDENNFYKGTSSTASQNPTQSQRKDNLQKVQKIVSGQSSISSLKDHCKFISSLALLSTISQLQFAQLLNSLESVTQTVSTHSFYVRKVVEYQTPLKLVRVYKLMWRLSLKKNCQILVMQMLKLFLSMSKMKQRKQVIFSDEQTVQFFKMVVKRRLNTQGNIKEMQSLIEILYNCRNNNQIFFSLGLISMLVEIINRDKDSFLTLVLQYFIKIDLTPQIINEIYQRGSFNTLVQTFSIPLSTDLAKKILSLWIRLAGKVCINQSIQEKFRSTNLHQLVWSKISVLNSSLERKDIAYFFAYLCLKNQAVTQWMIQSKVPQEILSNLGELTENQQLYLLFYHFCFGNNINRDYCFRIKYHLHLLNRLNLRFNELKENQDKIHLNKYFYKSLGQLMNSSTHISTFFKEEAVKKLVQIFNAKCEPCIYESLLDFISALQTEAEFDELKRQNFWDSLKIFEFKISSQATYSYLLQIFLIMIKKGRTKQFSTPELRNKVCLKAEFSINMEGKELALRFILALSIKDKENYMTERCVGLLASVLGVKVSRNQLQLAQDILKVEGVSKNEEFLNFFLNKDNNIHALICQNVEKLTPQELKIALNILLILSASSSAKKEIADICMPIIKRLLQKQPKQHFALIVQLLSSLSNNQSNRDTFQFLQIDKIISSEASNKQAMEADCLTEYNQLRKNIQKMKGGSKPNNQQMIKKAVSSLRQGKKVKMYKTDGSVSQLLIFISFDCLELNCAVTLSQVVKQKWRLPLNEITKVIEYVGQESSQFQNSYFQKNSGFFSKAPNYEQCLSIIGKNNQFRICFSFGQKEQWKKNFEITREYARNLLSKVSNK